MLKGSLIVWLLVASVQSPPPPVVIQTPELLVEAPVDPAITVQRTGGGYSLVLTNNTTHDIIGLAVRWVGVGPTPQTRLWDSYPSKPPVVPAKGMIVLNPERIEPVVSADQSGRRVINPETNQRLARVSRVLIRVDVVVFDNGIALGPDDSGLVGNMKATAELPFAEAKWAANRPQVYEFTYKQICFCPPPPPGKPGSEPIVFRVINDIGSLTGAWADRPQAREGLDKFSTVEKQFEFIRAELTKHPAEASIDYDPDDGHPTRVHFNAERIADADYGFTVEGFTVLNRK